MDAPREARGAAATSFPAPRTALAAPAKLAGVFPPAPLIAAYVSCMAAQNASRPIVFAPAPACASKIARTASRGSFAFPRSFSADSASAAPDLPPGSFAKCFAYFSSSFGVAEESIPRGAEEAHATGASADGGGRGAGAGAGAGAGGGGG